MNNPSPIEIQDKTDEEYFFLFGKNWIFVWIADTEKGTKQDGIYCREDDIARPLAWWEDHLEACKKPYLEAIAD